MSQVLEAHGQLQCYEKKGCFLHRPLQYHTNMHADIQAPHKHAQIHKSHQLAIKVEQEQKPG